MSEIPGIDLDRTQIPRKSLLRLPCVLFEQIADVGQNRGALCVTRRERESLLEPLTRSAPVPLLAQEAG